MENIKELEFEVESAILEIANDIDGYGHHLFSDTEFISNVTRLLQTQQAKIDKYKQALKEIKIDNCSSRCTKSAENCLNCSHIIAKKALEE